MDVPKTRPKIDFELAQQYLAWRDSHTNVVSSFVYQAMVTRIVDGDTIDVIIRYDVGFNRVIEWSERLRFARIDAPERRRPTYVEGVAATEWVRSKIPPGTVVWLHTSKDDAFGRYIADIHADLDGHRPSDGFLNDAMVAAGMAIYKDY